MVIFGDTKPLVIIGLLVSIADLIIFLIGFSTPYWYRLGQNIRDGHMGLWQTCSEPGNSGVECMSLLEPGIGDSFPNSFKGARALECLALVAFVGAVVCSVLKTFVMKDNGPIYLLCVATNFIAGFFGLIGVIVYATMKLGPNETALDAFNFSFSFAFAIIASIGGIFTAVLFFLARRWVHLQS